MASSQPATDDAAASGQRSSGSGNQQSSKRNLWKRASDELGDKLTLKPNVTADENLPDEILNIVQERVAQSRQKQWKFRKKNGEEVFVRDVFQSIIECIDQFKSLGDVIVQYDPAHAALPWAGVRLLLQVAGNDVKTNCAMAKGIQTVARVIARNAEVEKFSLVGSSNLVKQLEDALVVLYKDILLYLDSAYQYFKRSTGRRLAASIIKPSDKVSKHLSRIETNEAAVDRLVSYVTKEESRHEVTSIQTLLSGITDSLQEKKEKISVERKRAIMQYLNAIYTHENLEILLDSRHKDTTHWIRDKPAFREWITQDGTNSKLLWVYAPPGHGKSVLCASIVAHLQEASIERVAYFFCVSEDEDKRDPCNILKSWITQIIQQNDEALRIVSQEFDERYQRPLTVSKQWQVLQAICREVGLCYLIVDGFDECSDNAGNKKYATGGSRSRFLQHLVEKLSGVSVRILLVSRDVVDIRRAIGSMDCEEGLQILECKIEEADVKGDLTNFSQFIIDAALAGRDVELRKEAADAAMQRADGMFLWLHLLRKKIRTGDSEKEVLNTVLELPVGLEQAYERDISNIIAEKNRKDRERSQNLLKWILFAQGPMTLGELIEANLVRHSIQGEYPTELLPHGWHDGTIDEGYVDDIIRKPLGSLVEVRKKSTCSNLKSCTIHVTHHSVKEYLLELNNAGIPRFHELFALDMQPVGEYLAEQCLKYLCLRVFSDRKLAEGDVEEIRQRHPFLTFSSVYWRKLLSDSPEMPESIADLAVDLFDAERSNWKLFIRVRLAGLLDESSHLMAQRSQAVIREIELVNYDKNFKSHLEELLSGIEKLCSEMAKQTVQKQSQIEKGGPLYFASRHGMMKAVRILYAKCKESEADSLAAKMALDIAIVNDNIDVAIYLLQKGVSPTQQSRFGSSPLLIEAVSRNQKAVVKEMISTKGKFDHSWRAITEEGASRDPLTYAARGGHDDIVTMFIDAGADLNWSLGSPRWYTPLGEASLEGNLSTVDLLLRRGANIQTVFEDGLTALHVAAMQDNLGVVRTLLSNGADVNAKSSKGLTPLHILVEYISNTAKALDMINLLVDCGADVNARTERCDTPLHFAKDPQIVERLLKLGADPDAADHKGFTLLHSIQLLPEAGDAAKISSLLLEHGADIGKRSEEGYTPLHHAQHEETVKVLLSHGADMAAKTSSGLTPLWVTIYLNHSAAAKILVAQGSDVDTPDYHLLTPIYVAVSRGDLELIELLLDRGVDIESTQRFGETLLMMAVRSGQVKATRTLLKHGANAGAVHSCGQTPLSIAMSEKNKEIALDLLEAVELEWPQSRSGERAIDDQAIGLYKEYYKALVVDDEEQLKELTSAVQRNGSQAILDGAFLAAVWLGPVEIVQMLLNHGANLHAVYNDGRTALHMGAQGGSVEVVKALLRLGLSPSCTDKSGRTPVDVAVTYGMNCGDVIEVLTARHLSCELRENEEASSPDIARLSQISGMKFLGKRDTDPDIGRADINLKVDKVSAELSGTLPCFAGHNVLTTEGQDMFGRFITEASVIWAELRGSTGIIYWGYIDLVSGTISGKWSDPMFPVGGTFNLKIISDGESVDTAKFPDNSPKA